MVELSGKSAHEVEFELKQRAVFRRVRIKLRQREEKKLYHGKSICSREDISVLLAYSFLPFVPAFRL